MTLAINTTDAFATGTIANTGLGNRGDKSFSTGTLENFGSPKYLFL